MSQGQFEGNMIIMEWNTYGGVKSLDPSSEHFGRMGDGRHIFDCKATFSDHLRSSTRSKEPDIVLDQPFGKVEKAGFIVNRNDSY